MRAKSAAHPAISKLHFCVIIYQTTQIATNLFQIIFKILAADDSEQSGAEGREYPSTDCAIVESTGS